MRLYLIFSALLLSACMGRQSEPIEPPPIVPADLLQPVPGYIGPVPATERQMIRAWTAEMRGRQKANAQLATIGEILQPPRPQ